MTGPMTDESSAGLLAVARMGPRLDREVTPVFEKTLCRYQPTVRCDRYSLAAIALFESP